MIIVVLHINTYLQPSTFCTNPYKYDLSFFPRSLQTNMHDLDVAWINCTVVSIFGLWLGYMFLKNFAYSFIKEENTTEAINNLKKTRQMSIKYAATSDQKSLMCFVNGKPSSETILLIQKNQKPCFTSGLLPVQSTFCSSESLWRDLV